MAKHCFPEPGYLNVVKECHNQSKPNPDIKCIDSIVAKYIQYWHKISDEKWSYHPLRRIAGLLGFGLVV